MQNNQLKSSSNQMMFYNIRGQQVVLENDLSEFYGINDKSFKKIMLKNMYRFPTDFCFQLTAEEFRKIRVNIPVNFSNAWNEMPFAFTEQGVSMLASVLPGNNIIIKNIEIIRMFARQREISIPEELKQKLKSFEQNIESTIKRYKQYMK